MFEHFGIMDIWSGFKKYKISILTFILMFSAYCTIVFLIDARKVSKNSKINEDTIYISSSSYYVEPSEAILVTVDPGIYQYFPDDYVAMLQTDFFKKYLFDKLTKQYSKQFIVENSGLNKDGADINFEELSIDSMKELYWVKKYQSSMVLEVSSMTYSEELSEAVKNICIEFLISNANIQTKNSSIKFSGEATRFVKTSDLASESVDKNDTRYIVKAPTVKQITLKSVIKKIFIPIFLVVILCIGFILFEGLLNPKLNRISDFSEYDIPVIGEIKSYKKVKEAKGNARNEN
mgnify:CR=1 FL=1